jgi:hypothetical protein
VAEFLDRPEAQVCAMAALALGEFFFKLPIPYFGIEFCKPATEGRKFICRSLTDGSFNLL